MRWILTDTGVLQTRQCIFCTRHCWKTQPVAMRSANKNVVVVPLFPHQICLTWAHSCKRLHEEADGEPGVR